MLLLKHGVGFNFGSNGFHDKDCFILYCKHNHPGTIRILCSPKINEIEEEEKVQTCSRYGKRKKIMSHFQMSGRHITRPQN